MSIPVLDLSESGRADAAAIGGMMTPLPPGGAHHDLAPGEHLTLRAANTRWRARVLTVQIRAQGNAPWQVIRIKRHGTVTVAWSGLSGLLTVTSDKPGVNIGLIRMPSPEARLTMRTMSPGLGPQPPMEMSWTVEDPLTGAVGDNG